MQYLFPILFITFITVACGAISGFHSLVSSGTTSKQLDKETDARQTGHTAGATDIFAGGISAMVASIPGYDGCRNLLIGSYREKPDWSDCGRQHRLDLCTYTYALQQTRQLYVFSTSSHLIYTFTTNTDSFLKPALLNSALLLYNRFLPSYAQA